MKNIFKTPVRMSQLKWPLFAMLLMGSFPLAAKGSKAPEEAPRGSANSDEGGKDPYVSDELLWDTAEIALSEIFRQEVYANLSIRGESVGDFLPSTNLTILQSAFFGTIVRFLSENPALGGDYARGFDPRIWKNIVKVMMERVVPMTPDGVLLLPTRPGAKLAVLSSELRAKGMASNARLFMVDKENNLLGPTMTPIKLKSFETIDGEGDMMVGSGFEDFSAATQLQKEVNTNGVMVSANSVGRSADRIVIRGEEDYSLVDCFSLVASGKKEEAKACFDKAGEYALSRAVDITLDVGETAARGAAAGALIGTVMPGIGSGAGAAYGALTNVLMVGYNAFLKKEKISPNTLRRLAYFIDKHTYIPNSNGEIMIKPGMRWVVTNKGVIRQGINFGGRLVAADINGNPIMRDRTVQISQGAAFSFPERLP